MSSKLTSGLQKQYLLVLAVIGSLAILGAVLLEVVVVSQGKGAEIINIAGRQRMLSQRIDLYSNRLSQTTSPIEKQEIKQKLNQAVNLFKSSHDYLRQNTILINAPAELSALYNRAPHHIDQHVLRLFSSIDRMMAQSEHNTSIDPSLISQISLLCETLLPKLDQVVSIHQIDQEEKTAKLRTYQWLNLVILLSILILSAIFIFQRMLNKLQSQVDNIAEAEERFRSITHSAEISVVVASGEHGLIEAWNPAAERTFGYTSEEAIGQPVSILMPERYRDRHDESLHHAYLNKDHTLIGHTIELEALHKDGHEFPIELSLGSWQSKGQKYFSAIIHNITARKKNEQERENLRQQLITAIESMTEGFALFDKEDRLVIYNSVFCDFYKNHVDSIHVGQTLENILRSGLKNGSFPEAVGHEEEWLAKRMKQHVNPSGQVEQQLQDGRWLSISEHKTKDGGVVGVRTDITQRRMRESELRKLKMAIEQSRSIILISDANGVIEYANPYFTQITGYRNDEIIGQRPNFFTQSQENKLKDGDIWKTILSGNVWQGRIENYRKDGTLFIEETVITPIRDDKGKITHFLAIQDDITEQLRLEDVIKKQQKLEAVGQLAGGLAHDFNNLLAIISGNLELLIRLVGDDEKIRKKVETALKASNRGAKLTKQLLGFTRQSPTSIQTVNVNNIITEISPLLEHSLSKSIKLKLLLSDNIHLVDIDPGDFEDCLVNLAVNAKHAISHDGELLIETTNIDSIFEQENPQDRYVQITVSDNGYGIPADIQDKIFEPFFSTKEKGQGTGLGLAMVFGFVRRSSGYIRVYSEEGVGTSFKIFLPRSIKDKQDVPCSPDQLKELPGGNEHILIVDDEKELLELAKTNLEHAGYRVTATTSADNAISILQKHRDIDLLFSDVIMPGKINGFDLAITAQQVSPRTKIQLTSGYTAQAGQDLIEGNIFAKQLYQNLLSKPYSQAALLQTVRRVLDAESLIEWTAYLDTGIPMIDDDHKMLVALLNRLHQACLYKEDEKIFHSILKELAHYTEYHFQREESLMEEIGYPHLKNHKQVHKLLANFVISELKKVPDNYNRKNNDDLLHFLKNWLIDHIMGMDQDIGSFVSQSAAQPSTDEEHGNEK